MSNWMRQLCVAIVATSACGAVARRLDAAKRWSGHSAMLVVALCYVLLSAWAATTLGFQMGTRGSRCASPRHDDHHGIAPSVVDCFLSGERNNGRAG